MKVAYCIPVSDSSAGVERALTIKANYFAEVLGYDIYVILTGGKGRRNSLALSAKITVVHVDIDFDEVPPGSFIRKAMARRNRRSKYKRQLKEVLFDLRPDITVSVLRREIVFLTSIDDGSRKIAEMHGGSSPVDGASAGQANIVKRIRSVYRSRQLLRSLNRLDRLVVPNPDDVRHWPEVRNTVAIPNPLSFFSEDASFCSPKIVIAAGGYFRQNGLHLFTDAWMIISKLYPDWTLRIYGAWMKDSLTAQIERLGLGGSCFLHGSVAGLEEKFTGNSLLVLSSASADFALVVAEAMACGIPVISFDFPSATRKNTGSDVNSILEEMDHINSLASKISYLIEDDGLRRGMGKMARKNMKRFKIENIGSQWKQVFESLCREPGSEEGASFSGAFTAERGREKQ
jgi:glycosyltransferase involved in cell wall biosynthesis